MDEWLKVISVIVSILSLLGVGTLFKLIVEDRHRRRMEQSEEAKRKAKEERQQETKEAIKEEIQPLADGLVEFRKTDAIQKSALQSLLRDRLYELYRYCCSKGYTNLDDRDNFENLFVNYHGLGGNGVMQDIHDRFFELPTKEEYNSMR